MLMHVIMFFLGSIGTYDKLNSSLIIRAAPYLPASVEVGVIDWHATNPNRNEDVSKGINISLPSQTMLMNYFRYVIL